MINNRVMTDMIPNGYIMIPPLARISRKLVSFTGAGAWAVVAAKAVSALRKKPEKVNGKHFMNFGKLSHLWTQRKPGLKSPFFTEISLESFIPRPA